MYAQADAGLPRARQRSWNVVRMTVLPDWMAKVYWEPKLPTGVGDSAQMPGPVLTGGL